MELISPTAMLAGLFFLFFMATLIKAISLKRKKDRFLFELTETTNHLAELKKELKDVRNKHDKAEQFKESLTVAELTTQLQKPRLSVHAPSATSSFPERYSFVHSLIQKKMSSDEIASILSISCQEAEQLVVLSKLGRA
jgi:hypothetical protein